MQVIIKLWAFGIYSSIQGKFQNSSSIFKPKSSKVPSQKEEFTFQKIPSKFRPNSKHTSNKVWPKMDKELGQIRRVCSSNIFIKVSSQIQSKTSTSISIHNAKQLQAQTWANSSKLSHENKTPKIWRNETKIQNWRGLYLNLRMNLQRIASNFSWIEIKQGFEQGFGEKRQAKARKLATKWRNEQSTRANWN